jgi:hypothetical protein
VTAALTKTLELATAGSVTEANRHVRILEETLDPGRAEKLLAQQRQRSFLRMTDCENGMVRLEALLDPERATTLCAAIDVTVSAWLRARQYDKTEPVPEDVANIEQLQAQALTRFAEVFLAATPAQRGVAFTSPVIYAAPLDPTENAGLADSIHGRIIPRTRLAPVEDPAAHLLKYNDNGQPVLLDGEFLDQNPQARLASGAQRIALAWRDKTCSEPGCGRPASWALHAHHKIAYGPDGPTIMENLVLVCSQHHDLIHHPGL